MNQPVQLPLWDPWGDPWVVLPATRSAPPAHHESGWWELLRALRFLIFVLVMSVVAPLVIPVFLIWCELTVLFVWTNW